MPTAQLPNGSVIGYLINGELDLNKSTILVLHAFLSDKTAWNNLFESPLSKLVNFVAIDLHGHGETSGRKTWTYWDNAEDVVALMDHLSIGKAAVIGLSQGGFVAYRLAIRHADRILAIALINTTPREQRPNEIDLMENWRTAWTQGPTPTPEVMENAAVFNLGTTDAVSEQVKQDIKATWTNRHSGEANLAQNLDTLYKRDSVVENLGEIKCPVLIIHSMHDPNYVLAETLDYLKAFTNVPRLDVFVVKSDSHLLPRTQPLRLARRLANWVQELLSDVQDGRF